MAYMSPPDSSSDHLFSIIFKCITYDVISLHHIPFRLQASITFSPYYVMKSQKKTRRNSHKNVHKITFSNYRTKQASLTVHATTNQCTVTLYACNDMSDLEITNSKKKKTQEQCALAPNSHFTFSHISLVT